MQLTPRYDVDQEDAPTRVVEIVHPSGRAKVQQVCHWVRENLAGEGRERRRAYVSFRLPTRGAPHGCPLDGNECRARIAVFSLGSEKPVRYRFPQSHKHAQTRTNATHSQKTRANTQAHTTACASKVYLDEPQEREPGTDVHARCCDLESHDAAQTVVAAVRAKKQADSVM